MSLFVILILIVMVFFLSALYVRKSAQVSSLKEQLRFLEINLKLVAEQKKSFQEGSDHLVE